MSQETAKFPGVPEELKMDRKLFEYLQRMNKSVRRAVDDRPAMFTPLAELLMYSPSKKVYRLKVSDAGVLSTELVQNP